MPFTSRKAYSVQTSGSNAGTWGAGNAGNDLNTGVIEYIDTNMAGNLDVSLTNVDVTLTTSQARNCNLRLTGTLTGNVTITNANQGFYYAENLTTGAFTVTITNGVAGTTVTQGDRAPLFADTTYGVRQMVPAPSSVTASLTGENVAVTGAYTVSSSDARKTLTLGGTAFYTVTIGAASGFASTFCTLLVNTDATRAKRITPSGVTSFLLWPGQSCFLSNCGSAGWGVTPSLSGTRWRVVAAVTFYVDPINGNDSNDGLATGTGAMLTIQAAVNRALYDLDTRNITPTVQLANGTYSVGFQVIADGLGSNQVQVTGNTGTPSNVVINTGATTDPIVYIKDKGICTLTGVTLTGAGTPACIQAEQYAVCDFSSVVFGTSAGAHVKAIGQGRVNGLGNYSIGGNAPAHLFADRNGIIEISNSTVTLSTVANFSSAFAEATELGIIHCTNSSFSGSATGPRYLAVYNAGINTSAGGANYFPGNSAGSVSNGGYYI